MHKAETDNGGTLYHAAIPELVDEVNLKVLALPNTW